MIVTVASGKGGTGKTTFAVNLAYALAHRGERVRLLDCDVEEPDDQLFVKPYFSEERDVTVLKPVWDKEKCTGCGECAEACNYNAIAVVKGKVLVFNELCHSCGACTYVCPEDALREEPAVIGKVEVSSGNTPFFFAHGVLNIGETLAPKVVQAVKTYIDHEAINIIDASPGTAYPVVQALEGADVAVLLTEPTPFGLHDLKRTAAITLEMGIPAAIVVNRSEGRDFIIADWAERAGIPVVGRIPFARKYAETYSAGDILVERHEELKTNLLTIYEKLCTMRGATVAGGEELASLHKIEDGARPFFSGTFAPHEGRQATDCREVAVISGKGGTGKTTVAASFAFLAENQVLADNDVDATDLHLLLMPRIREAHPFVGGVKATVDHTRCDGCGKCAEICHFDAFRFDGPGNDVVDTTWRIDPLACEGCGLCSRVCPTKAIRTEDATNGEWYVSETDCGPMVHAQLGIVEQNSGRLVTKVRNRAAELAAEFGAERILGDGPPGTGCPVIASVSGCDLVLVVTEPTVSGVHDMERVLDLAGHFGVPALVIINKSDLNLEQAARIGEIAEARNSRVIAHIPFDNTVNAALMAGEPVVEYGASAAGSAIRSAWKGVLDVMREDVM